MSQIFEEASTFLRKKVTEFNDVKDLTNWAGSNNLLNDSIVKTRINELSKMFVCFHCNKCYAYKHTYRRHLRSHIPTVKISFVKTARKDFEEKIS